MRPNVHVLCEPDETSPDSGGLLLMLLTGFWSMDHTVTRSKPDQATLAVPKCLQEQIQEQGSGAAVRDSIRAFRYGNHVVLGGLRMHQLRAEQAADSVAG